ncbi:antibiotic biosynthesis monooxygenase [Actinobacillus genomosp. 1]|uniref:putative quinol monooxygenase n=1 Tax=Actinobacillus genomosp. 1 TaxID=254839 RepID=UPI0024429B73|nr:putative quinol monooxygenase [Actinobacillus genomosp. 1]WGE33566.1 antibiotic biosynthesis monooxygenase [Actinobacillus genomosp. 1]
MIAVYAVCHVKAEKIAEFEALAKTLVSASLNDQGCISYGCGAVQGQPKVYTFVEQWQSQQDLALHAQQAHFIDAGAKFAELLSQPIAINIVDLLDVK